MSEKCPQTFLLQSAGKKETSTLLASFLFLFFGLIFNTFLCTLKILVQQSPRIISWIRIVFLYFQFLGVGCFVLRLIIDFFLNCFCVKINLYIDNLYILDNIIIFISAYSCFANVLLIWLISYV